MKTIIISGVLLLLTLNLVFTTYTINKCNQIIENQQKSSENLQKSIENATSYLNKYFKY